jgi:hypothetical protein
MQRSGQFHAPAASPPGKRPRYPFDRRLGGPRVDLDAVAKRNNLCFNQESKPGRPARSLVTTLI